jgi:hypothetical protein
MTLLNFILAECATHIFEKPTLLHSPLSMPHGYKPDTRMMKICLIRGQCKRTSDELNKANEMTLCKDLDERIIVHKNLRNKFCNRRTNLCLILTLSRPRRFDFGPPVPSFLSRSAAALSQYCTSASPTTTRQYVKEVVQLLLREAFAGHK